MPSSSAYAAPIDLDLRPGSWEQAGRVVAVAVALGALSLADLPLLLQLLGAALAVLIAARDGSRAARRPQRMRLYADGSVECTVLGASYANVRDSQAATPVGAGSARDRFPQFAQSSQAEPAATGEREAGLMHPATILQATTFLGLAQLRWADASDLHHACVLFRDRINADTRHRLHVWLATHRPEKPLGVIPAGSTPQ